MPRVVLTLVHLWQKRGTRDSKERETYREGERGGQSTHVWWELNKTVHTRMSKRIKNRYKGPPYQWLQRAIVAPTELYRLEREIGQILSAKEDNLPQPDYDNSSYRVHTGHGVSPNCCPVCMELLSGEWLLLQGCPHHATYCDSPLEAHCIGDSDYIASAELCIWLSLPQ